jgi:hypothetical protein
VECLGPVEPPAKIAGQSAVREFATQIVHKLAVALNSDPITLRTVIGQLCSVDFHVTKKVVKSCLSHIVTGSSKFSNTEEFVEHFKRMETFLPDLYVTIHSFRDYANKSGYTIKCEYKYKGTLINEPISDTGKSSGTPEKNIELSSDSLPLEATYAKSAELRVQRVHCVGTLYIHLNYDNKITHLEFIGQYV